MIQLARMMLYDDEESRDVVSEVFATCFPQWGVPNRWLEFQADSIQQPHDLFIVVCTEHD